MAVPDFQSLMLPVLREVAGSGEVAPVQVRQALAASLGLTEDDLAELLPSGRQTTFANRVAWALAYLKMADLLVSPRRGAYKLTERGAEVLEEGPDRIDINYLERFPEFVASRTPTAGSASQAKDLTGGAAADDALTPDEQIRAGYEQHRAAIAAELLERVRQASPRFFEQLVVDLLMAMDYGGSRIDAGSVVGKTGDEGIDGIIKQDKLGLDSIYLQAKRWKDTVGRPEIQRFAGALQGKRASKGVFITTSTYSPDARAYATAVQSTIILLDGKELAELMMDHGVGVSVSETFRVLRIDEDAFVEEVGE